MNSQALAIPVRYGEIQAQVWSLPGDDIKTKGVERYIALHGWQDNSGTFDRLIPLLNKRMVIVAVDLPGHGSSSHFPVGFAYNDLGYAMDIKRIASFLGWESFSFLGHSMGGYLSIYFASLYPDKVNRIICLDIVKPLSFKPEDLASATAKALDAFIDVDSKDLKLKNPPTYTKEDAVKRLIEGHAKIVKLSEEGARVLLKRGAKELVQGSGEVVFTRDHRLRALMFTRSDATTIEAFVKNLKCELLIVKAKDGIKLDDEKLTAHFLKLYDTVCKRFSFVEVEGHHHAHLCQVENVAPVINNFLKGSVTLNGSNGHSENGLVEKNGG